MRGGRRARQDQRSRRQGPVRAFGQQHPPGLRGRPDALYRKLPHRGFNQAAFRTEIAVINVGDLGGLDSSVAEVDAVALAKAGLIRKGETTVKVLGDGEISRALKVSAARFSATAKAKIEAAGGQAIVV